MSQVVNAKALNLRGLARGRGVRRGLGDQSLTLIVCQNPDTARSFIEAANAVEQVVRDPMPFLARDGEHVAEHGQLSIHCFGTALELPWLLTLLHE